MMRIRGLYSPSMRKRLLDLGLGSSRYVPFVILGRSRVGSNLLRGLLNAHPAVTAFGEIFRDLRVADWDHTGYFDEPGMLAQLRSQPVRFLDARVFGRYPSALRAVGFKLFYYHARTGPEAGVWPYLRERKDVRILHLKRRNLLQTHVSRQRAALTDRWVNTSGQSEAPVSLRLDFEECLNDFLQTRAWEEECDRQFAGHQILQVAYEDLAADYPSQAARIQHFLGVPARPVAPSTFQQAREPLPAIIANYAELKARFSGTPWAGFFTD